MRHEDRRCSNHPFLVGSLSALASLLALTACGDDVASGEDDVASEASPNVVLAGEQPKVVLGGLRTNEDVEVVACRGHAFLTDPAIQYVSRAVYRPNAQGRIDLGSMAPLRGSYEGADPWGILWSMREEACPFQVEAWSYDRVRFVATQGTASQKRDLTIRDVAPAVVREELTLDRDRMIAHFYRPSAEGKYPAVVLWGGSDGMIPDEYGKALASRGYAALAIQYFDYVADPKVFPNLIQDLPLEYFGRAIDWALSNSHVSGTKVTIMGSSRGGEAALLVGSRYAEKLNGVIALRPSDVVWGDRANGTFSRAIGVSDERASWTYNGEPVPFLPMPKLLQELSTASTFGGIAAFEYVTAYETVEKSSAAPEVAKARIDVTKIPVPILASAGADDKMWPAPRYVARIKDARSNRDDRFVIITGAGHVTALPGRPTPPDLQFMFPNGIGDHMEGSEFVMVPEWAFNGGSPRENHRADVEVSKAVFDFVAARNGR